MNQQTLELQPFAAELSRQHFAKRDFIADARDFRFTTDTSGSLAFIHGIQATEGADPDYFQVSDLAHSQVAEFCDIPKAYYDRMRERQHGLLDTSVHTWLDAAGKRRMVRTLDGRVRAFLSDRYRRIDNYDLANVVLPELQGLGAEIRHLAITERKMYIKAVFPHVQGEVKPGLGDIIQLGVTVENSEVGEGSVSVMPMSLRLVCLNGMTHNKYGTKRNHVGSQIQGGEEAYELFSQEAMEADDKALLLKVRDVVRATSSQVLLDNILGDMRESQGILISTAPALAVAELARTKGLTEGEGQGILEHLLKGGSMTQWGLVNAITRQAQDVESYDRANELERLGGDILSMARSEFGAIATASEKKSRRRS